MSTSVIIIVSAFIIRGFRWPLAKGFHNLRSGSRFFFSLEEMGKIRIPAVWTRGTGGTRAEMGSVGFVERDFVGPCGTVRS